MADEGQMKLCSVCQKNGSLKFCELCRTTLLASTLEERSFPKFYKEAHPSDTKIHLIDRILNELHQDDAMQINSIIIVPREARGYGDLIFAAKLYDALIKHVTSNVHVFSSHKNTYKGLQEVAPHISVLGKGQRRISKKLSKPDFMIVTPYINRCSDSRERIAEAKKYGIMPKFVLALGEYGWNVPNNISFHRSCKSTGLYFNSLGIFINDDVERYDKINDPTFKMFYDKHIQGSKIYFGYGYKFDNSTNFINLVLRMNNDEIITIFSRFDWIGDDEEEDDDEEREEQHRVWDSLDFVRYAKDEGYTINVVGDYREDNSIIYSHQGSNSKTLLVLNTTGIKYSDMQYIIRTSDKFMLVTGDQSLSDAISNNKVFIYEALPHKYYFEDTLRYLVKLLGLNDIIELWNMPILKGRITVDPNSLRSLIYNTDEFTILNSHINNYYNLAYNVVELLRRYKLYMKNPNVIYDDWNYLSEAVDPETIKEYFIQLENMFIADSRKF